MFKDKIYEHMCVCVCVYTYVCMYIYTYVYVCVYTYVYLHMCIYVSDDHWQNITGILNIMFKNPALPPYNVVNT